MQKYKIYMSILILLLILMPSYTVFAESPSDKETIQQHLELVESGLRERDVSHLSPTLQKARIQNLNTLRVYWKKGVFPRNTHHEARTPYFIDDEGRTCAMAQLLIDSGYEEEAVRISQRENYSYVHDMKSPELAQWLETSGLTLQEAAWIQPNYEPVRPEGFIGCQCDCSFAVVNDGQSAYVIDVRVKYRTKTGRSGYA